MCSVPFPPFLGAEAYGQWTPEALWGSPTMPRTTITVPLADAQPGAAFKTAEFAMLNGIQLDDPLGEWPGDRRQVAGAPESEGSPVNGATWLDPELTSPYAFYQYWLNSADADVMNYLRYFSFRSHDELSELAEATRQRPAARAGGTAIHELALTVRGVLAPEDADLYEEVAIRVAASRWATEPEQKPAGKRPVEVVFAPATRTTLS